MSNEISSSTISESQNHQCMMEEEKEAELDDLDGVCLLINSSVIFWPCAVQWEISLLVLSPPLPPICKPCLRKGKNMFSGLKLMLICISTIHLKRGPHFLSSDLLVTSALLECQLGTEAFLPSSCRVTLGSKQWLIVSDSFLQCAVHKGKVCLWRPYKPSHP